MDISHLQCIVVVAGISGAGKSKALDAISDLGFFNLENLPVSMLKEFLNFTKQDPSRFQRLVILPDITSSEKLSELLKIIDELKPHKKVQKIFLDCANDVVLKRYSETRRPHPSFIPEKDKTLVDAVERERNRLNPFREKADLFVDSSQWSIHDLRRALTTFIESIAVTNDYILRLNFLSFGFKYGIPADCDLVIDARFLPNPFFVETLKDKDGLNPDVSKYVLENPACSEFMKRYTDLLQFMLPQYVNGGKAYLNVGIGCTGGKHRSVAIAEELAKRFKNPAYYVSAKHRDRERG